MLSSLFIKYFPQSILIFSFGIPKAINFPAILAASRAISIPSLFPLISKRYARGERYYNIFFLSAILIGLASALIVGFYWLFPNFAILALYGSDFLEGASFLWLISLFMALVSISNLFVQFYLSIGKTVIVWPVVIASGLQAILIWFIHPDLLTVIKLSILSSALLVAVLLAYFPFHARSSSKQ